MRKRMYFSTGIDCSLVTEFLTWKSTPISPPVKRPRSANNEKGNAQDYGPKKPLGFYLVDDEQAEQNEFPMCGTGTDLDDGWVSFGCLSFPKSLASTASPSPYSPHSNTSLTASSSQSVSVDDLIAIDCEMVVTIEDEYEVARVSCVDARNRVLIDEMVRPTNKVIDYKTEFSGVSEKSLEGVTTTLSDIQKKLKLIIKPTSVIVGHSVDNDLRCLKIVHGRVIDTSLIYPHQRAFFKHSLQYLANGHLDASFRGKSDKRRMHPSNSMDMSELSTSSTQSSIDQIS
eukprot:GHVN01038570.1.p1 GENE.GHVN01038570.1~~GHVN01038570.1.p1  ORF type:complete len:286 (+),score=65.21 GHVN01038570.1:430-1287(+)